MKNLISIIVIMFFVRIVVAQDSKINYTLQKANESYYITDINGITFNVDTTVLTIRVNDFDNIKSDYTIIRVNRFGFIDIRVPANTNYSHFLETLEDDNNVTEIIIATFSTYLSLNSNDPYVSNQWYLNTINAYNAWDITTGDSNIIVAILDSGVEWEHDDLGAGNDGYQNIYLNPNEDVWGNPNNPLTGNGVDDDNNGFIDDWKGWSFDGNNNDCRPINYHGTFVTGIISAKTNNFNGISGIAGGNGRSGVKALHYCVGKSYPLSYVVDDAIIVAVDNGARIIQLSLSAAHTPDIDSAILYAKNHDVVVVCASGNNNPVVTYPATHPYVIAVGATDNTNHRTFFSCYGDELSVVAPGESIYSTTLNNLYDYDNGTSFSAPQVSAIAALILSVNSNYTAQQVRYIIETTAQKVGGYNYQPDNTHPNGKWNNEMGYGLVDAYNAVKAAKGYDLFVSDIQNDGGSNNPNLLVFDSPDIWLRRAADGGLRHQVAGNGTNYLYVRLHNSSSTPSAHGTDSLKVFARLNQGHSTNILWDNTLQQYAVCEIPEIPAGGSVVLKVPVTLSTTLGHNFDNYTFYVRIASPFDTLTVDETIYLLDNVKNNNNIAAKNVVVTCYDIFDINEGGWGAITNIRVPQVSDFVTTSNLNLNFFDNDSSILEEAEVTIVFPDDLLTDWTPSSENLKQISDNTYLVTGETVELLDIPETDISLHYNFLTRRNQPADVYKNHIVQYINNGTDEEIVGTLTIQIEKSGRLDADRFHANAGNDTAILIGTNATLHAAQINENATYRWYDKQRNFKYEGLNYTVTPSETSEYILEVTAESDGYRDLDTVKVNVVPGCIRSITPNPVADNWISVSYEYATTVTSAYLYIYNTGTTTLVGSYDLSNLGNVSSLDVEVTTFPTGSYTLVLVCDNAVCHSKVLIRQ